MQMKRIVLASLLALSCLLPALRYVAPVAGSFGYTVQDTAV